VISDLSAQVTLGIQDPLAKARVVYDYVLANIRYDKSGSGWGHGNAIWACTAKRGNCTDFHSLLIGMLRAAGIPARFEIGFPLPSEHAGAISAYHCWAEFYIEPYGEFPSMPRRPGSTRKGEIISSERTMRTACSLPSGATSVSSRGSRATAQLLHLSLLGSGRETVRGRVKILVSRPGEQR